MDDLLVIPLGLPPLADRLLAPAILRWSIYFSPKKKITL